MTTRRRFRPHFPGDPTGVDQQTLQRVLDIVADLQAEAATFAQRDTHHPWRGCIVEDASYSTTESLLGALATVRAAQAATLEASGQLQPYVGALTGRSFSEVAGAAGAFRALAETRWLPRDWANIQPETLTARAHALRDAATTARKIAGLRQDFAEKTDHGEPQAAQPLLADALGRFGAWYKRLLPAYGAWKKEVRRQVRPRADDHTSLTELARLANEIGVEVKVLEADRPDIEPRLRPTAGAWPDADAMDDAARAFDRAAALREARVRLNVSEPPSEALIVESGVRSAASRLLAHTADNLGLSAALETLQKAWAGAFVGDAEPADVPLGSLGARCAEAESAPERLNEWVVLHDDLGRCRQAGLEPFVNALASIGSGRAVDAFRRRFWLMWTDAHIARTPSLRLFSGNKREEVIREFTQLDGRLRKLAVASAIDGAAQRAAQIKQATYANRDSQLGILQRELQKKRPRPLRKLFAEIPHVLQAVKPCMLMSPVSVSTYLTPGSIDFDIVVFDEASQLPPAEAIPSILRARQVVVAGDDKQLPPTSFFSSSLFADESDDETEDSKPLESLLRECAAAAPFFQPSTLLWHYRSRDERLIAFSNHAFYEGELITFPSPGGPADRGVQLRFVDKGVWDRGKSRTNRVEARVVADLVVRQLDEHPERSVGVAALSVTQKEAIEDALEEQLALRADLRTRISDLDVREPFFIKSLENVQGDERDTMIISTGYGPDANGTINLNFGPLNQESGWRRLNVLVTRAKYLTILVTSLRSADLQGVSPDNRGATALRQFIEYAERGGRLAPEGTRRTDAETNDFEDAIAEAIRARGLTVDEQVGASSYRIDLAIRDPRDERWYALGVECDGATYHSSRTARDRDVLRADMLRSMSWHLHRVWSVDWFRNPKESIDAVVQSLQRALALGEPGGEGASPT